MFAYNGAAPNVTIAIPSKTGFSQLSPPYSVSSMYMRVLYTEITTAIDTSSNTFFLIGFSVTLRYWLNRT